MGQEYRALPFATSLTRPILLLLWAALSLSLIWYVLEFGHNQPWADEWEFVPTLTGNEPVGPFFLHPHNEHRLPLPRLIYIGLWGLAHDFRAGMILQVSLLSGMAYRGMRLAAWLRGAPHWADAFFPVGVLHFGHCENLLMGYQLCFVLASALVGCVLELALRLTPANAARTAALAALAALALALSGGFGIVFAAPILSWAMALARADWRSGRPRDDEFPTRRPGDSPTTLSHVATSWTLVATGGRTIAILLGVATVSYCGYYFATYERPPAHPPFELKNWDASLQVAGEFLGIAFGIGIGPLWLVALALILAALAWVTIARYRLPDYHLRSLGMAAVCAGVILLSLTVGAGRGGFGAQMGLWPRYTVLAWPLLAAIALTAIASRGAISRLLPPILLVAAVVAFQPNSLYGLRYAELHDAWLSDIERQLREGEPVEAVVDRSLAGSGQAARALRGMPMLRGARIGPFAGWNPP